MHIIIKKTAIASIYVIIIVGKIEGTNFSECMSKKVVFENIILAFLYLRSTLRPSCIQFCAPKLSKQSSFHQIHQILLPPIFSAIQYHISLLCANIIYIKTKFIIHNAGKCVHSWNNHRKIWILLIIFVIIGSILAMIGGILFIPAHGATYIIIQNKTSSVSVFHVQQPKPLVALLANFNRENYSAFVSNMSMDTDASCSIWIAEILRLNSNQLGSNGIILPDNMYTIQFYALTGSTLNVTFSSLTGSDSAYIWVNLREYVGPGVNGSVFKSQLINSTMNSPVVFTVDQSTAGFIDLNIANYGLSGKFSYNIITNQPSLERSRYICTLNSTCNTCQGTSVYNTNYVLAETTLDSMVNITVTLVGREKQGPDKVNLSYTIASFFFIGSGGIIVVIIMCIIAFILVLMVCL